MIKMKISTPLIAKTLAVRGFAASNYIAIQREQGTGNFLTGKTHRQRNSTLSKVLLGFLVSTQPTTIIFTLY